MNKNKMGEHFKKLRKQKGITQLEMGARIGVSQQVVTNYERGLREPSLDILIKMAGVLGVTLEQIVGTKPVEIEDQTSRALQKRLDKVKKLPLEKQKAFISFIDALSA